MLYPTKATLGLDKKPNIVKDEVMKEKGVKLLRENITKAIS